ncbi:uncharacterized protein KY384_000340 [Bacidia gigantensis]|uniref:uncharacterized protein n=1 Tax=Bacidia gigantensis TaxID=2732470 RepID=UPI001D04AE64|nr:uncharacterized protein KY384_000340 [Bacidia gigantensis]KAG8526347.1 hypothetical protein KY384_000340 [Bacidia gigantensis]
METSTKSLVKAQYHHFIPRFILRNFAHPFEVPAGPNRRRRKRSQNGCYPGDPMLHTFSFAGSSADIGESPVAKTLGITDMYRDFADLDNPHHIEEKLSKLESRAAVIINTVRKAFEKKENGIWINRTDRDILRKFLFIMKYRGSTAHKRFYHDKPDDYSSNDKERLQDYMRSKGFKKPIDVWFDNINAMLDLDMDPEQGWMTRLLEQVYPDDAMWFIAHVQMMYLAFCTPSDPKGEFLLSEFAYSIHEGPVHFDYDIGTNKTSEGCYTEYHCFAAIAPQLMIVLRSFMLPVAEEDVNEEIKAWREDMFRQNALLLKTHDLQNVQSILKDLPITKASNFYTQPHNNTPGSSGSSAWSPRSTDRFCFKFFPISVQQTDRINFIMLENSYAASTMVFKTPSAAKRTLQEYLTTPCEINGLRSFKTVENMTNDPRFLFIKKLEQLVSKLGTNITATISSLGLDEFEKVRQKLADSFPKEPTGMIKIYTKLGGSGPTLLQDLDQASKMLNMRIKIDVWSKHLPPSTREDIREKLGHMFCTLPTRRLYFYLKRVRVMLQGGKTADRAMASQMKIEELMEGKGEGGEDVIANAAHLIRAGRLGHLLYFATINEIHKSKILGPAGSICDCGIEGVESGARGWREMVRVDPMFEAFRTEMGSDVGLGVGRSGVGVEAVEEKIEVMTRVMVRRNLRAVWENGLAKEDVKGLEKVLFETVFPCPPG